MRFFSVGQEWFASDPHQDFHLPSPEQWNTLVRGTKLCAYTLCIGETCCCIQIVDPAPYCIYPSLYVSTLLLYHYHITGTLFPPTDLILESEWNVKCDPDCSTLQEPIDSYYWFINVAFHVHKLVYENGMRPLIFLQHPGDTVYIPDKWVHALMNLDDCFAVTQGYGSLESNLREVWKQVLVKGNHKDWRNIYFTILNATQRRIVRDEVQQHEVCVQYYGDDATDWNKLCKNHEFYSQIKNRRRG